MALQPVTHSSLSEAVFEQLSQQIVHGERDAGSALPSERILCEELQVNRGAVREALKRLAQAGLVAIRQGGATRVLDYRQSAGLDLLARLLLRPDGSLDPIVGRSVLEMRSALGPEIAAQCARRRNETLARELCEVASKMESCEQDQLEELSLLGMNYWQLLCKGSENIAYELACNTLQRTYEVIRPALLQAMATELRDRERHRAIAEAVRARDTEVAARVARELLGQGERHIGQVLTALTRARAELEQAS